MYLTYEKLRKTKQNISFYFYLQNKTKYFLCYNLICVLSICKEDSAKEKGSSIPKVFEILSNFKVFLTGFQTTKFYVTTWKLLRTLRQNSPIKFALAQK